MKQAVVNISDLNSLVLTDNGRVVGYVTVEKRNNYFEFVGRATNVQSGSYVDSTFNGFACGMAIRATDSAELSDVDNFRKALSEAGIK
jgi:hypothetical protein